jgi:hypothetical protein
VRSLLFGRLVTSPLAFLAAGIVDAAAYWLGSLARGRRTDR